jgi:4-alpha-glucanotransferase
VAGSATDMSDAETHDQPGATEPFDHGPPSGELVELARAYDIATDYWDWRGRHVLVSAGTIRAVLGAFDVVAETDQDVREALRAAQDRPWRRVLPPIVVTRQGSAHQVKVHVDDGAAVQVWVDLELGGRIDARQVEHWVPPRNVDGRPIGEATFELGPELPVGWHAVHAETPQGVSTAPLVVTPDRLELPAVLADRRAWGFMTQLYSVRSSRSWGIGDLADLAELAGWSGGDLGADFVLVNPLNAAAPVPPMDPSPYLPTTRRFVNPIYIRVEDIREVAYMPSAERQMLEWHADDAHLANSTERIDRDRAWEAKSAALDIVHRLPRSVARQRAYDDFRRQMGPGLVDFATWCALTEDHGLPATDWPAGLDDPRSPEVEAERQRLADRVDFFAWLQWIADEQLGYAQQTARGAGMGVGVIHDIPVGVHPLGADAWSLSTSLASGVRVGAPPDPFNQQGQNWSQPPLRPDRLEQLAYAPYRDMLRTVLRHAGGVRVDHVIGLFRLWWVPEGQPADQGTYVRYDHEALVGILALEAQRAGAVVIGEDLGTVEPWVRDYLRDRGIFGTSILWFERDEQGRPLEPERWRELCLATVTTHDLPPTAGYLAGEHIRLRDELGLLTRPVEEERAEDDLERAAMLDLLHRRGLLKDDAGTRATVEALHRLIAWTPARLIGVALTDAVGEVRTINQPGTDQEYPNWQLPLSDEHGRQVLLEELIRSRRARDLARAAATG